MDTVDISSRASEYAGGKAVDCLTKAIEQAYKDGYLDGFKDGKELASDCISTGEVNYVDLGLPSGTLWSDDYVMRDGEILYWPYGEASDKSIPTDEQWKELQAKCAWRYVQEDNTFVAKCIGPNGQMLRFRLSGKLEGDIFISRNVYFWTISDAYSDAFGVNENLHVGARIRFHGDGKGTNDCENCFVGIGLPIRLVKNSD